MHLEKVSNWAARYSFWCWTASDNPRLGIGNWICKRRRSKRPPALHIKSKGKLLEQCTIQKDNTYALSIQPSPLIAAAPAEEGVSYYSEAEGVFTSSLFTHLAVYSQLFILIRLSYPYTILPTCLDSFEPELMKQNDFWQSWG